MKLPDLNHRKQKNQDIEYQVSQHRAEEEPALIELALFIPQVQVPECLYRHASEADEEDAGDEPEATQADEDLDRNADAGEFEEAPVEDEDGEFAAGDAVGVGHFDAEHHYPGLLDDFFLCHGTALCFDGVRDGPPKTKVNSPYSIRQIHFERKNDKHVHIKITVE